MKKSSKNYKFLIPEQIIEQRGYNSGIAKFLALKNILVYLIQEA